MHRIPDVYYIQKAKIIYGKSEKLEQKISCMGNIFPNTADSNDQRLWQPQLLFNGGMPKAL